MVHKKVRISPRILRILVLLAQGPKYSGDFIRIDPENFTQERKTNGAANIYMVLRRAKDGGLIEEMPDTFVPPAADGEEITGVHLRRAYYRISAKGRASLQKAQSLLTAME